MGHSSTIYLREPHSIDAQFVFLRLENVITPILSTRNGKMSLYNWDGYPLVN
jgi:hypothetical protein